MFKAAAFQAASSVEQVCTKAVYLHQNGQFLQAQSLYEQVLRMQPKHFEALHYLGLLAAGAGNFERANELISRAIKINSKDPAAYYNRGNALQDLHQFQAAVRSYEQAIALKPDYAEAYSNLGNALQALKQHQAAVHSYDKAISIRPDFADAYSNRGNSLCDLKQYETALQSCDKAIALNPDFADAYSNRGNALQGLQKHQAAVNSYDKAISLRPRHSKAHANRGNALQRLQQHQAALDSFEIATALRPDYAEAHWSSSLSYLAMGNLAKGWPEYEWRRRLAEISGSFRNFAPPLWLGSGSLSGRTILLYSEQGLGDTIQFCRYASMVADLGAHVILEVQGSLVKVLGNLAGVSKLIARGDPVPAFDFHCPLLSLPLAFHTELDSIPATNRYLTVNASRIDEWRARLGSSAKPRIGLVWSGSSGHMNDANRSIPLSDFVDILSDDFQLISLQKEVRDSDREILDAHPEILHFAKELDDFTDTAALCELVDVVVSVDTSVGHLAGALGTPVWILLAFSPDWRWLLKREDSPWYPSARLYRQREVGGWHEVIQKVNTDLTQLLRLDNRMN